MRYQDQVVQMTQRAVETLFRTARAMPADKLTWKPLDNGRTALDQLQECAQVPTFFKAILEQKKAPEGVDEKYFEEARKRRQQWKTLDECEQKCLEHSKQLFEAIGKLSDKDLQLKIKLPFGKKEERSLADLAMAHYTNTSYHTGQINYIQTLYGDHQPH